jgi:hypothetical protein
MSVSILLRTQKYQTEVVEKIKTNDFNFFFSSLENRTLYETTSKKYCRAGQATDDHMVHAYRVLDK